MLESIARQSVQPAEIIVVDASTNDETRRLCENGFTGLMTRIVYHCAIETGAAPQRNQAMPHVSQGTVWFIDDDVVLQPDCLERLWNALENDPRLGGVNAMIVNQKYSTPGLISRLLFQFLHGRREASYAGKCIGPALHLLPEDKPDLPEVVSMEWLNTTCTLYRREALPELPFPRHFRGYSMMEDVALSLVVGRRWKLANARLAGVFHDTQSGGGHKEDTRSLSEMELINRHFVMTRILGKCRAADYLKLTVLELFIAFSLFASFKGLRQFVPVWIGKLDALRKIARLEILRAKEREAELSGTLYTLW